MQMLMNVSKAMAVVVATFVAILMAHMNVAVTVDTNSK